MLVDRENGRPVRKLELRAQDGRLLGAGDTEVDRKRAAADGSNAVRDNANACAIARAWPIDYGQ